MAFFRRKMEILLFVFMLAAPAYAGAAQPAMAESSKPAATGQAQASWAVRCGKESAEKPAARKDSKSAPAASRCEAFQRLTVAKTGQRVIEFAIGFSEKDKRVAHGILILPLGILLTDDPQMQVDNGKAFKFKVRYCAPAGCYAFLDFNQSVLDTLRAANAISITIKASNGRNVAIKMKMDGLAQALKKL